MHMQALAQTRAQEQGLNKTGNWSCENSATLGASIDVTLMLRMPSEWFHTRTPMPRLLFDVGACIKRLCKCTHTHTHTHTTSQTRVHTNPTLAFDHSFRPQKKVGLQRYENIDATLQKAHTHTHTHTQTTRTRLHTHIQTTCGQHKK